MSQSPANSVDQAHLGEPTWSVALLFPSQGNWSEQEYLALDAGRQIEFDHGFLEVLDLPTIEHQRLVRFLFLSLQSAADPSHQGEVFFAPLPVQLWPNKYREPDLVFLKHDRERIDAYPFGADLVIEVLSDSPADRKRDLQIKRDEYEKARISEYWIVDALEKKVIVHQLIDQQFVAEVFTTGQVAHSKVLIGLSIDVGVLFNTVSQSS